MMSKDQSILETPKANYEAPVITKIGQFEVVTQHTSKGGKIDMAFTTGTPISEILASLS